MMSAVPVPARLCALARAVTHLGVTESSPGSNRGPLIDKWNRGANGVLGEPWCMSFLHGMFGECGVTLGGWAGVQTFLEWARLHGYTVVRPLRGDLICFDWNHDRWYDHVGIVDKVLRLLPGKAYVVRTVEGNTADAVRVKLRTVTSRTTRYVRVPG